MGRVGPHWGGPIVTSCPLFGWAAKLVPFLAKLGLIIGLAWPDQHCAKSTRANKKAPH
jgi:hypothetical protein